VLIYQQFINYRHRKAKPVFIYKPSILITKQHQDLTISFKGVKIENLCKATIVFFNAGGTYIGTDDSTTYPHITFPKDTKILSSPVIKTSDPASNFSSTQTDKAVTLKFHYLNSGHGAVIDILYEQSHPPSKTFPGKFYASFMGAHDYASTQYTKPTSILLKLAILFGGLISCAVAVRMVIELYIQFDWKQLLPLMFAAFFGSIFVLAAIGAFREKTPPKFAQKYFE